MQIDNTLPITLTLNVGMANVILGALSTQPYERVAEVIALIQQQARPQIDAAQAQPAVTAAAAE